MTCISWPYLILSWYFCVKIENMLSVLRNVRPWCVECISFSVTGVASGVTSNFSSLKIPCGAGKVWGKGRTCLTSIRDSLHWVVAIFSSANSKWQNSTAKGSWLVENIYEFMPTVWRDQIYRYQDFFRRPKSPRVSKKSDKSQDRDFCLQVLQKFCKLCPIMTKH